GCAAPGRRRRGWGGRSCLLRLLGAEHAMGDLRAGHDGALDGAAGGDRTAEHRHDGGDLLLGEPLERQLHLLGDREVPVLLLVGGAVRPQPHVEVVPQAAGEVHVAAHTGAADEGELQQLAGVDLPFAVPDRDLDAALIAAHERAGTGAIRPDAAGADVLGELEAVIGDGGHRPSPSRERAEMRQPRNLSGAVLPCWAPALGFEPRTARLTVECSAVELCGIDLNDFSRIGRRGASRNRVSTGRYDEGYLPATCSDDTSDAAGSVEPRTTSPGSIARASAGIPRQSLPSWITSSRRVAVTLPYSVAERPIAVIGGRWVRVSAESS